MESLTSFPSSSDNHPHLMDRVGFLFKQFLADGDFCFGDPGDLVSFALDSGHNKVLLLPSTQFMMLMIDPIT